MRFVAIVEGCLREGKMNDMSTIAEIENAVRQLPAADLAAFRTWFVEFDAENWDRQFESDVKAGKLDWLREEALRDLREGRCTER